MSMIIWSVALVIYLLFRWWYDGVRRPMTPEEVENFMGILRNRGEAGIDEQELATIRRFLEEDDGKEFLMVNLIEFNASPVVHPDTGEDVAASELLQEYFQPFMGKVLRRAGHPVVATRALGGYLDAWNTPVDPGWDVAGLIRYRSRRDAMLSSLADPAFDGIHKYKVAALRQTFAFPSGVQMGFYVSPRVTVALVLALLAALSNLVLLS